MARIIKADGREFIATTSLLVEKEKERAESECGGFA